MSSASASASAEAADGGGLRSRRRARQCRSASCWQPPTRRQFFRDYPYNVTPVSDDQPFFFYTVQPRDLWDFFRHASTLSADYKVNRAVPLLFGVVAISLAATAAGAAAAALAAGHTPAETKRRGRRSCGTSCASAPATF